MPLPPTVSCSSKIQIGFTFLVPADPGSPGQRAIKRCVCVNAERTVYFTSILSSVRCAGGAFSALTLLVGRWEGHLACKKTKWWGAGVVICLEQGPDLHMAQLMPLPLTVFLSGTGSPG